MPKIERNAYKIVNHFTEVRNGRDKYGQKRFAKTLSGREPICIHNCKDTEVYLRGADFRNIFGKKRADSEYKNKKAIVKVSRNGKSILCMYKCCLECGEIKDFVGLTYESLLRLSDSTDDINNIGKLTLSPGSRIWFYLRYSDLGTRIGIWALLITILSIVFALNSSYN